MPVIIDPVMMKGSKGLRFVPLLVNIIGADVGDGDFGVCWSWWSASWSSSWSSGKKGGFVHVQLREARVMACRS